MYLLSKGSNVNAQDNEGITPIYLAGLQQSNTYIISKLLKRGADPLLKNHRGVNAIKGAEGKKNDDAVNLMMKRDGLAELMNISPANK